MITKPDQNLLVRTARVLQANAKRLQRLYGADWNADRDAKQAKRDFDRLLKEERDLRALIKRLAKPGAVMANEHACQIQAPLGMRSYPITKLGELHGCLYVDEVDPERHRVVRRVTM